MATTFRNRWVTTATIRTVSSALLFAVGTLRASQGPPPRPIRVPPPSAETASKASATVRGRVFRQGGNDGLASVRIVLSAADVARDPFIATSAADGTFSFAGIPGGLYRVGLSLDGYFRPATDSGPRSISLGDGQQLPNLILRLAPTGTIAGTLIDSDGRPEAGISVRAARPYYEGGRKRLPMSVPRNQRATTDSEGRFSFFGLEEGAYIVGTGSLQPEYFPGVIDPDQAVQISVAPGREIRGITMRLATRTTYTASFRLEDASAQGNMSPLFQVVRIGSNGTEATIGMGAADPGNGQGYPFRRSADGVLTTPPLLPGSYEIYYGRLTGGRMGRTRFDIIDHNVAVADMIVEGPLRLMGRVVRDRSFATSAPGGFAPRIILKPADSRDAGFSTGIANLKPDWTFDVTGLPPGKWRADVAGLPPDAFVSSVRYGSSEVLDATFEVTHTTDFLEITISAPGAVVLGSVRDARETAVPYAQVALIPWGSGPKSPSRYRAAVADERGGFSIVGVAAGQYRVLAWSDVEEGAWLDDAFVARFQGQGTRVDVQGSEQKSIVLKVSP